MCSGGRDGISKGLRLPRLGAAGAEILPSQHRCSACGVRSRLVGMGFQPKSSDYRADLCLTLDTAQSTCQEGLRGLCPSSMGPGHFRRTQQVCESLSRVQLFVTRGLSPARPLCPWGSLGSNTGVGCHFLLQGSS